MTTSTLSAKSALGLKKKTGQRNSQYHNKQTPTTDKRDSTTGESSPKAIQQDYIQHREDWSPTLKGQRKAASHKHYESREHQEEKESKIEDEIPPSQQTHLGLPSRCQKKRRQANPTVVWKTLSHLQQTHGDGQRDIPLGECTRIEPVSAPEMEMETLEPTWKVMKERLDLDQLQDQTGFHTQCIRCVPKAASQIMNPFNSSLEEGPIPATEAIFTPKEKVARDIVHFRKNITAGYGR